MPDQLTLPDAHRDHSPPTQPLTEVGFPFGQQADDTSFKGWLASADGLAEWLRARGAEADRRGGEPAEEIAALRSSGLLPVTQPITVGGGGASWRQAMQIVRRVARGDSSIGQLLAYHYLNSHFAWIEGKPDQITALATKSVAGNWYWGGVVNPRDPAISLRPHGDAFVLNGRKNFATGASIADRLVVPALFEERIVIVTVPRERAGFTSHGDWDNFGQRLTESGSVTFKDFIVTEDEILGGTDRASGPPPVFATLVTPMIQLSFVNFYLGTAEGALEEAKSYVRDTTRPWDVSGVDKATDDPYILGLLGELVADLSASLALADRAGDVLQAAIGRGTGVTETERNAAAAVVYAAKVNSTRVSLDVATRLFELTGARATANRYGFDRFWRNIRTHTLHDPVAYKAREVGNFALNKRLTSHPFYL